jgi:hypothetical protein
MPARDALSIGQAIRAHTAVDDAQPTLFLIDTEAGRVRDEVVLKDVPKAHRALRAGQQPDRL